MISAALRTNAQIVNDDEPQQDLKKQNDTVEQVYYLKSKFFTFKNFLDTINYGDTLLTDDFPYFNPVHALQYPVADKGNIGSSVMPLSGFISKCGFNIGINAYDIYDVTKNEFKWHINSIPFAKVFVSPSSTYTNFWVGTIFSRNFKDVNLNIDYSRINNTGKYKDQEAKHTDLNFGIWKGGIGKKFNAFFNIIVNIHEEQENGGVEDPSFDPENLRLNVPVKLNDAVSRLEKYELEFTSYYRLSKERTFLGLKPYLKSEAGYQKGFYKFYDVNVKDDSVYYGNLLSDPVGLRNYIRNNAYHVSLAFYGINSGSAYINTGADIGFYSYNIESQNTETIRQLKLFAHSGIKLIPNLNASFIGDLYIGNFSPNYSLNAELNFVAKKIHFDGGLLLKSTSPSLMQQKLYLTARQIYKNDFANTALIRFYAGAKINKLGFTAKANYDRISSYIYFSDNFLPKQHDQDISLFSINVEEKIRIWKFHFDNNLHFFSGVDDVIPLPEFVLRSKFYIRTMLFKKVMDLQSGFEHVFYDKYYNYGYNAAVGNYYVQNKIKLDNFMRLDYFINAKISDFMIFIRVNNILYPFEQRILYSVIDHPHDDLFFRLGIKWTLLN
ncbi:MAG: putative porin [Deltaproteobacteria bacterium]